MRILVCGATCKRIERFVAEYILDEYYNSDSDFQSYVLEKYPQGIEEIRKEVWNVEHRHCCYHIWKEFRAIYNYFDDWVVIKSSNMKDISGIIIQKAFDQDENRIETINW